MSRHPTLGELARFVKERNATIAHLRTAYSNLEHIVTDMHSLPSPPREAASAFHRNVCSSLRLVSTPSAYPLGSKGPTRYLLRQGYNPHQPTMLAALQEEYHAWYTTDHFQISQRLTLTSITNQIAQKTRQIYDNQLHNLKEKHELALQAIAYARSNYFTKTYVGVDKALHYIRTIREKTELFTPSPAYFSTVIKQLEKFEQELNLRSRIRTYETKKGFFRLYYSWKRSRLAKKLFRKHNQHMYHNRLESV